MPTVSTLRFVLGLLSLTLDSSRCSGATESSRGTRALGKARPQPPMLWLVLGGLYILIGVVWLAAAFA